MTTKSPVSTCGAKTGLCLPRSSRAAWLASRPSTTPSASITCQVRWTSPGLGVYVRTRDLRLLVGIRGWPRARHRAPGQPTQDTRSAAGGPGLVPDRLSGLGDRAVGAEHQKPVEGTGEPTVVGDGEHGAVVGGEAVLERLGARDVEVVGRPAEQLQEVRLSGPVGTEHGDALAVEDLEVERLHESGELELDARDRTDAGASTAKVHPDVLLVGQRGRRSGFFELRQPRLHRAVAAGHVRDPRRLLLQRADEILQPLVLFLPAAVQLFEASDAVASRVVVRREAATVRPRCARLDRHDARCSLREQLAV